MCSLCLPTQAHPRQHRLCHLKRRILTTCQYWCLRNNWGIDNRNCKCYLLVWHTLLPFWIKDGMQSKKMTGPFIWKYSLSIVHCKFWLKHLLDTVVPKISHTKFLKIHLPIHVVFQQLFAESWEKWQCDFVWFFLSTDLHLHQNLLHFLLTSSPHCLPPGHPSKSDTIVVK